MFVCADFSDTKEKAKKTSEAQPRMHCSMVCSVTQHNKKVNGSDRVRG